MIKLSFGYLTDVGVVREANQDSVFAEEPLFAVADGMGGHQGGEVASAMALEVLDKTFNKSNSKEDLLEAVRKSNAKVWDKAQLEESLNGMGTTITAMATVVDEDGNEVMAVVNVGDSRAYLLRDGELHQITTDHSFVEDLVQAGEISAEEAETHPKRNILTRAIGVEPTIEADIDLIPHKHGDRFLLCSDGLVREVADSAIAATLRKLKDPEEAAKDLVAQAKANGGSDNITVIVVDIIDDAAPQEATPQRKVKTAPKAPKVKGPRRFTFRSFLFFLAAGALIGAGVGGVAWYARAPYAVGLEGDQIVIYRGHPDQVLWFKKTVAERTNVNVNQVLPANVPTLQKGTTKASLSSAHAYIANLLEEAAAAGAIAGADKVPSVPTETTTTTTTTVKL